MSSAITLQLEYAKRQFQLTQAQVTYWNAVVVSGGYRLHKTQRGRENTPEEIAAGDHSLHFRDLTDDEKLSSSLKTLQSHIQRLWELNDVIAELEEKLTH